jgi:hypothetical protein
MRHAEIGSRLVEGGVNRAKCLILFGERGGARTHDPVIKSHVLYRLSYALAPPGLVGGALLRVNSGKRPVDVAQGHGFRR